MVTLWPVIEPFLPLTLHVSFAVNGRKMPRLLDFECSDDVGGGVGLGGWEDGRGEVVHVGALTLTLHNFVTVYNFG